MALLNQIQFEDAGQPLSRTADNAPDVKSIDIDRITRLINQIRARQGVKPVLADARLMDLALNHSLMMASNGRVANSFGPGTGLRSRLAEAGLHGVAAENVGAGHSTVDSLLQDWGRSRGHLANLASAKMTHFGFAAAVNPLSRFRTYRTLILFRPPSH
jgi:uncharacterized protein YkwD